MNIIQGGPMLHSFLSSLTQTSELVFWGCAALGTVLFLLRTLMAGFFDSAEDSHDQGIDVDGGDIDADGCDTSGECDNHGTRSSFNLFTVHSISGFFMIFGWVGLACIKQLEYSHVISIAIAFCAGLLTMVLTAFIFKSAFLLVSPGAHFDVAKTIGLTGTVYHQIPAHGLGKIQIELEGMTREILAQSADHSPIASYSLVVVTKTLDKDVVIVKKIV